MTVQEAISARHSVRTYLTKPVEPAIVNALRAEIRACNAEGGLHIQLVMNEPMAFRGFFAHYGKFRGVCNYIVLAGKRAKDLGERAGWFGERLVLLAQTLGLNTCWVGLTFSKAVARRSYVLAPDERLVCVIHGSLPPPYRRNSTPSMRPPMRTSRSVMLLSVSPSPVTRSTAPPTLTSMSSVP